MNIDAFHAFTLAILLLFVGKGLVARLDILRRYSIPEALVGGLAWSDYFVETLGIVQAQELELAANMIGLIAVCSCAGINFEPSGTAPWRLARCIAMNRMLAWITTVCCWHCSGSTWS